MNTWSDCLLANTVITCSPDIQKAASLISVAKGRITFLDSQQISKEYANHIFEGFYTSIIEYIHALCACDGYKIHNQICLAFYLKEIKEHDILYLLFEDIRFRRNSLVYYGKSMPLKTAKHSINLCKRLLVGLEKLYASL